MKRVLAVGKRLGGKQGRRWEVLVAADAERAVAPRPVVTVPVPWRVATRERLH